MKANNLFFVFLTLINISCSSTDEDNIGGEQLAEPLGAYSDECKWIYGQMNRYYLWREDLPDSMLCDYTVDPVTFFKSLLSPKDRFSYCERNTNYTGPLEIYKDEKDDFDFVQTRSTTEGVLFDSIYTINDIRVGYFCYLKFDDATELAPILRKFKAGHINTLIIDLRYNPGGYVSTCRYLCNSIVHESGYGKVFQNQGFNDVLSEWRYSQYGSREESEYFEYPSSDNQKRLGLPLYGLNMEKVYALTSSHTASASEALIVCLRPYTQVVVIGEKTVGKGVGSYTIREAKYKYELHPITLRYYNANDESTPDDGIPPDYVVEGGYQTHKKDIGNPKEPLLNKALTLIVNTDSVNWCQ